MSISRVQGNQVNSSGSVTTQAITLSSGVALGNLLIVAVASGSNTTTITAPDASWHQATINQPAGASATIETAIYYLVVDGLHAGATSWTWTFSASHTVYLCIEEWNTSNSWLASPLDVTANGDTAGTPTTSTTISSGTTATTAQGEELWVAALAYKGSAQTESSITSGWTKDLEATLAANNTLTLLYKVASTTGTAACSYVIGTAQFWAGSVATFRDTTNITTTITDTKLTTFTATASSTPARVTTITDTALSTFDAECTVIASPAPVASSASIVSLFYQKIQIVQVFDPFGNFLALWPDAPHISGLQDTVNCAQGQIKMVLPRPINNYNAPGQTPSNGSVAPENQVKIYLFGPGLPATGLLKFNGFIDTVEAAVTDSQQQSVTVTLTPWSAAFGDHGYGGSMQFNTIDPINLFKYWFDTTDPVTGVKYTDPMTWDPGNPTSSGKTVNYLIQGLDLKSIADTIMTMLGSGWFWRPNPTNTVTLGQVPTTPQHTFQLGKHFASMSYSIDNTQRKNVIYVVGSSQSVKATAVGTSAQPPAQGGIGERLLQVQDSRLTDIGSCQVVANALLAINDVPQVRAKFRVVDYRGNTSGALGFDIEALKVGDAITILDSRGTTFPSTWGNFTWGYSRWGQSEGTIFNQVIPIASINYNWNYADVEAGILTPSQDRRLFQLQRKFQDFTLGV